MHRTSACSWNCRSRSAQPDQRAALLVEICRIHRLGWIRSKRLDRDGNIVRCEARNCGGYTLEAELGIRPNAEADADFLGFEVKQHRVARLDVIGSARITLMTPEPTGGIYREVGAEAFVRWYGRVAAGDVNRLDFVGAHVVGVRHEQTSLTLSLFDFDVATLRIGGENGRVALVDDDGNEAASWGFAPLMEHWRRKHAHAGVRCRVKKRQRFRSSIDMARASGWQRDLIS